jgi:hypothetical protein
MSDNASHPWFQHRLGVERHLRGPPEQGAPPGGAANPNLHSSSRPLVPLAFPCLPQRLSKPGGQASSVSRRAGILPAETVFSLPTKAGQTAAIGRGPGQNSPVAMRPGEALIFTPSVFPSLPPSPRPMAAKTVTFRGTLARTLFSCCRAPVMVIFHLFRFSSFDSAVERGSPTFAQAHSFIPKTSPDLTSVIHSPQSKIIHQPSDL